MIHFRFCPGIQHPFELLERNVGGFALKHAQLRTLHRSPGHLNPRVFEFPIGVDSRLEIGVSLFLNSGFGGLLALAARRILLLFFSYTFSSTNTYTSPLKIFRNFLKRLKRKRFRLFPFNVALSKVLHEFE